MRRVLKRLMLLIAALLIAVVASLVYSFSPRQIDLKEYHSEATTFHSSVNSNALPDLTLSLIKCGKMMSKQVFVFAGTWSDNYDSECGVCSCFILSYFFFDTTALSHVDDPINIPSLSALTKYDKKQARFALKDHESSLPHTMDHLASHWDT